jgi:hypothetical protein
MDVPETHPKLYMLCDESGGIPRKRATSLGYATAV